MKQKLLLLAVLVLPLMVVEATETTGAIKTTGSSMAAQTSIAVEATHLRVHRSDGTVVNALLDEQLVLDFLIANTTEYMALKQSDSEDTQIALVEIQKMTFGEAIVPETPDTTPEDSVLPAAEPNTMYVYHTNGTVFSASLDEQVVLRFLEDNMHLSILQEDPMPWLIADVQKITFGVEETTDTPTEVPDIRDSLLDTRDVQKVLENGQVVIIKNGVRYSVLGIRLM